jgi:NADH:flavin oxidoreductase / NADH oxidase family
MNSVLFEPFRLRDLTLPNRIVLSPMTRSRGGAARLANQLMAEYYTQRSSAGLLISEGTTISEEANGWNESPGIYTDEMTEGWKHTTNAVHEKGAVIFLQLWHTGRASHSSFHGGKPAVAPSAIKLNEPDIHTPTGKHHGRWKRPRFHGSWRTIGEQPRGPDWMQITPKAVSLFHAISQLAETNAIRLAAWGAIWTGRNVLFGIGVNSGGSINYVVYREKPPTI